MCVDVPASQLTQTRNAGVTKSFKKKNNTRRGLIKWGYNIGLKIQTQAVTQSGGLDPKTHVWKWNRKQGPSTENPGKPL